MRTTSQNAFLTLTFIFMSILSNGQTTEKPAEVLPPLVGGDTDKHGCKPSAGYTFSILKNDCVRLFEQEIQLNEVAPKKSYSTNVTIIFSNDNRKAELFISTMESSIILIRKGRRLLWKGNSFELSKSKDYILKKANKVIYRGK
jgi:hypothetical protein